MPDYRVELTPRAVKDIKNLPNDARRKVLKTLEVLQKAPRPRDVEKLQENPAFWRLWIGRDHRMIYTIDDEKKLIVVALVRNRKDAYRGIANLDAAALIAAIEPIKQERRPAAPQ